MKINHPSAEETLRHKQLVQKFMLAVVQDLQTRALVHDDSKLEEPEVSAFDKVTVEYPLDEITFNSPKYHESLEVLKPALEHHYAVNRHHPQHFKNGIKDMNLIDLIEMLCDWKASTARQSGGNLLKSIESNADRFTYTKELSQIFENTAHYFEGK